MSWSLNASGHTASEEDEKAFLDKLAPLMQDDLNGVYGASISTQYHGAVNLREYTAETKAE